MKNAPRRFDQNYFHRYYEDARTRAVAPAAQRRQADFIAAYLKHLDVEVKTILDVGCGLGQILRALGRKLPRARCVGVEFSPYLRERYGWEQGSVIDYEAEQPFDLVVCNDVLPSLDDASASAAIENLATLTGQVLFLGALTKEDWARCDKARTDRNVHLRAASWYRKRLRNAFIAVGGGLFLKRDAPVTLWSLDCLE